MRRFVRFLAPLLLAAAPHRGQSSLSGTLVVTNKTPSTATIIDVASARVLATQPTQPGPHKVVMSHDGRVAVVSDYGAQTGGSTLTVIDLPGDSLVGHLGNQQAAAHRAHRDR